MGKPCLANRDNPSPILYFRNFLESKIGEGRAPWEVKHLSTRRKRKKLVRLWRVNISLVAASEKEEAQTPHHFYIFAKNFKIKKFEEIF